MHETETETEAEKMGTFGRICTSFRRAMCRRFGVLHLRVLAITLVFVFSCLTLRQIAFPRAGNKISHVRTNQELESTLYGKLKTRDPDLDSGLRKSNSMNSSGKGFGNGLQRKTATRRLFIHCELRSILTWHELGDLVDCVRVKEGEPDTKPCLVECPGTGKQLEVHLGTDLLEARRMDAILFGLSPFTMLHSFQRVLGYKPPPGQLVVFYSMENVLRMHKWNYRLGILRYHVDMTYGSYSNVSIPYSYFKPYERKNASVSDRNWMEGKTELVAWMASNCKEVFWPRNEFIAELQRFIKIDTYGRCGNLTCLPRLSEKCIKMLTKYKFYLSIENSECDDYLTEKIWASALENDVIPIVYGPRKSDYEKYAPPNSFIHVSDFDSVEELAKYIQRVAGDAQLYNSYFKWRETGWVYRKYPKLQPSYFCDLLQFMDHVPGNMTQVKDSEWFNSCRHEVKVYKRHNLTEIQRLSGWKPWKSL